MASDILFYDVKILQEPVWNPVMADKKQKVYKEDGNQNINEYNLVSDLSADDSTNSLLTLCQLVVVSYVQRSCDKSIQ